MPPHISQDVTDISSVDQLLRYAAAGQLTSLLKDRGYKQEEIALGAGWGTSARNAGPVLARALGNRFTTRQLGELDEIIGALAPDVDRAGGLSSLELRLSADRRTGDGDTSAAKRITDTGLAAHVPPSWTRKMIADPPAGEIGVLMQASGLLAEFAAASRIGHRGVTAIRDRCGRDIDMLARRLALVSVGRPGPLSYDAQTLLGMLACYCFDQTRDGLERAVRYSPMGFRVWRPLTRLVMLSGDSGQPDAIRDWIRDLLLDSGDLRKRSLYAGSSYDLELALTVPPEWSPPGDDWVGAVLRDRARDPEATLRERGTAAMGLWQRAITEDRPDLKDTESELHELIAEFRDPATRPDAAPGLRWIAATLESLIDSRTAVCNNWPDVPDPWYQHVRDAAGEVSKTGIPDHMMTGTRNLFLHMILQNAGLYRRYAIETVVTSGMTRPVASALASLLRAERQEAWLRVRVQAAMGFMQRAEMTAQNDLKRACQLAFANTAETLADKAPLRSQITELHGSLFAVGDSFGSAAGWESGRHARDVLRPVLSAIADMDGERALRFRRPARAAAYLLSVTAQPRTGGRKDLSEELLEKLCSHPDQVTSRLSSWILSFRFAQDGTIRPLLAAAELGEAEDTPY